MSTRGRDAASDRLLALLLFTGIVTYLAYLPHNLGIADESHFLYESKRIREGEVMYRDFFQFLTPGASYTMAFLFWAFGTTMTTARISTAVLHGLTGVFTYATCRALRVRRALAVVPPLAYIALCQSSWQFASWHWFGTVFIMLALLTLVRGPWVSRPRWAIVPGVVIGLLSAVEQHRGLVMAVAVGLIFVLDDLVDRRYREPPSWRNLAVRLSYFSAGIAIIVIPLLATFVVLAGFEPVFYALVHYPLGFYGKRFGTTWGNVIPITRGYAEYTFPLVLKYLPVVLLPACLRVVRGLVYRSERLPVRTLIILIVYAGFAALSVRYFPDFIHISFVAPVFLVAAAEALEWTLTRLVRPVRLAPALGWVLAGGLIAALALQLGRNALKLNQQFATPHETAFGRVDMNTRWEPILIDTTRKLLAETASHELFCYPNLSKPYLTTGGRNPTPFQWFFAAASPPEQTERVVEILKTRPVPYVIGAVFMMFRSDPVVKVINENYEVVRIPELAEIKELQSLVLYRRKDQPPTDTVTSQR